MSGHWEIRTIVAGRKERVWVEDDPPSSGSGDNKSNPGPLAVVLVILALLFVCSKCNGMTLFPF
mgnify:CR=1 FL=1